MQKDVEGEMRRLRQELKQTMEMYNNACKEAIDAKQKVLFILIQSYNYKHQAVPEPTKLSRFDE